MASCSLATLRKGFWRCALSVPAIAFYLLLPPAKVLAQEPTKELIEAAKKEGQLTFWSTTGEVALQIFAPFLKRYGLKLEVFDGSANALVERVITEAQAGTYTPDLLNTSLEWLTFVDEKQLLASDFKWPNISKWTFKQPLLPKVAIIGVEPRPAIFNTEMIPQKEWPRGPIEKALVNPKFEGLSALSTSSEEFPMVYAYLWGSADKLNWERSFAFFERLAKVTKPRAVRGYTPSQRLLAAGDFGLLHFGLFSRAFRDARDGAPVGVGAVEPMTASLVNIVIMKNAPHPNAARLAAGWLTTTEGQEQLSKSWGNLALDPHAQSAPAEYGKKWGVTIDKISFVPVNVLAKKDALKKSEEFYRKLLGVSR